MVSIKSTGAAATRNGQYKKRGAAATRNGQYKMQGRCRNEKWAVDRKSTRLNSSHRCISYAVFCLKKKKKKKKKEKKNKKKKKKKKKKKEKKEDTKIREGGRICKRRKKIQNTYTE